MRDFSFAAGDFLVIFQSDRFFVTLLRGGCANTCLDTRLAFAILLSADHFLVLQVRGTTRAPAHV